jgi:chromosome segregation ATPase
MSDVEQERDALRAERDDYKYTHDCTVPNLRARIANLEAQVERYDVLRAEVADGEESVRMLVAENGGLLVRITTLEAEVERLKRFIEAANLSPAAYDLLEEQKRRIATLEAELSLANGCIATLDAEVERLSAQLHAIYQAEARRQAGTGEDEVRHPDDYDALPEHTKDYDRVLARYILSREATLEGLLKEARVVVDIDAGSDNPLAMSAPLLKRIDAVLTRENVDSHD